MRIAYICADPGIPVFGTKGASVHIQEIVRAFRERGDEVTVYCSRRGTVVPADLADLRVADFAVRAPDTATRERAIAATAQLLAAAAIADGCDLVYERYSLFSTAGATVKAATGAPLVVEVNAPLVDEQRTHRVLTDEGRALADTVEIVSSANVVVCVSAAVAAWVEAVTDGSAIARTVVAPNGVNTTRIVPAAAGAGRAPAAFTVGFVGTLKPWHGVDVLLRAATTAASTCPSGRDWRLVIAGAGPQEQALRELAGALFADGQLAVEFTGAVAPEEIPLLLRSFDVAVAPYPEASAADQYFSPLKVYEYLAAGLPVIASAVGQIPAIVEHNTSGLLVVPGNADALAAALLLLETDFALCARLGAAARSLAVERHDWSAVLDRALAPLEGATV
jgi:glycosyltransferase involved in cell wall biosynthesis